jgi:hypothetical protein
MANIYDNPYYDAMVNPKTPKLALEPLYPNFGAPILADRPFAPQYGAEFVENELPYLKELTPTTDMATGIVPLLKNDIPTILNKGFINAPQDYYGGISSLDPQRFQAVEDDDLEASAISEFGEGQLKQPGGIADILKAALGFVVPGANLFLNKGRDAMSGIRSLNQRLRNTDFGQSSSLADYLDARSYGGRQERDDAAARNMAQARGIQKKIDRGEFNRDRSGITDRGRGQIGSRSSKSRSSSRGSSSYSQASQNRKR